MSKPEFYACCPDCYNSHGDCADGGECPCHKGQPELRSAANWAATGGWPSGYRHSPATYVEGREAPRPCGHRGLPCECEDRKRAAAREAEMLEACARAAYEAWATHRPSGEPFSDSGDEWRKVARAVLAAAGRGGK